MAKTARVPNGLGVPCRSCPLHELEHFRCFSEDELDFMSGFKIGELRLDRGTVLLEEGARSPHIFTVLEGWTFRHKSLEDGKRQVLNYPVRGDLIGLQAGLIGDMQHTVEALTPVVLCVFEKSRLRELFERFPTLAFDITWLAAREERILDEHLLSIGRRSAVQRAAYLLAFLSRRARAVGLASNGTVHVPVTQHLVADTLGLSTVHTNKTLKKLAERKLIRWRDSGCDVLDDEGLMEFSGWFEHPTDGRPFI